MKAAMETMMATRPSANDSKSLGAAARSSREPAYEVEYAPLPKEEVTNESVWFRTECADQDQAFELERAFHRQGWCARAVGVTSRLEFCQ